MLYQYIEKLNLEQMPKVEVDCPLCHSPNKEVFQEEFGFKIAQCKSCKFVYTSFRFSEQDQGQWYEDHFRRYPSSSSISPIYQAYFDFIKDKVGVSRGILDIGSGYGEFLSVVSKTGIYCAGAEINSQQRAACQQLGLEVFASLDEIAMQKFDVITLWAVLEHLQDPLAILKTCYARIQKGDKVVVLVPNLDYALIKLRLAHAPISGPIFKHISRRYGLGSGIFSPMEHLNHFNLNSLSRTFQQAGFSRMRFFVLDPVSITIKSTSPLLLLTAQRIYTEVTSAISSLSTGKIYLPRTLVMEGVK